MYIFMRFYKINLLIFMGMNGLLKISFKLVVKWNFKGIE